MIYTLDDCDYSVIIQKKNNKNTYLRIDDNLNIVITTSFFTTKKSILNILDENKDSIKKMIERKKNEIDKKNDFYYLGKKYSIISSNVSDFLVDGDYIFGDVNKIDKWYKKQMKKIFSERLEYNYHLFDENIPFPSLRIRLMKTRWGVCNIKTKVITLNSLLLKYDIEKIDYVIIHELSHLIHANHSKEFWNLVSKYCPKYKEIRKALKG